MNERIEQLAEQAKDYAAYYGMLSGSAEQKIFTEKFAELIVEECTAALFDEADRLTGLCIGYIEEEPWVSSDEYGIRSSQCVDDVALIEKHFGIVQMTEAAHNIEP